MMTAEFDFHKIIGLTIDYWCIHDQLIKQTKVLGIEDQWLVIGYKKSSEPGNCRMGCQKKCRNEMPWHAPICKGETFPILLHQSNFRGLAKNQQLGIF